ncbi:MAG: AAA family ATPase [Candidatus Omnitrophica bacterium]|nr:AAA family ATPase [Candidatus Omnitrophota bacterium]
MSYYQVLGFEKEPFSTSPDPDFFYLSKEHEAALTNILIELRLKRGLSVILGDVGMGKTTLSRKLIPELKCREDFIFHIILDPSFAREEDFLAALVHNFELTGNHSSTSPSTPYGRSGRVVSEVEPTSPGPLEMRDSLEKFLFQKGVSEGRTIVLIIDEAQKLNRNTLECLRVLLNYETNEYKLLQLVLLGQLELHSMILGLANFFDRISFKYTLNPLCREETGELIDFRLRQAGYQSSMQLFLDGAVDEIFHFTRGYPRKITMLCHRALKALVMRNRSVVDRVLIRDLVEEEVRAGWVLAGAPVYQK